MWDRSLKKYGNKMETKKAMAPLVLKLEKSTSPHTIKDIKKKWHSLGSSVLRYMKKSNSKEIKWLIWDDMLFLGQSVEKDLCDIGKNLVEQTFRYILNIFNIILSKLTKSFTPNGIYSMKWVKTLIFR